MGVKTRCLQVAWAAASGLKGEVHATNDNMLGGARQSIKARSNVFVKLFLE